MLTKTNFFNPIPCEVLIEIPFRIFRDSVGTSCKISMRNRFKSRSNLKTSFDRESQNKSVGFRVDYFYDV